MGKIRKARTRADLAASALDLQRMRLSVSSQRVAAQLHRHKPGLLIGGGFLSGMLLMAPTRDLAQFVARLGGLTALVLRSPLLNTVLIPVWQIAGPSWMRRTRVSRSERQESTRQSSVVSLLSVSRLVACRPPAQVVVGR